jgi:hypothetical protein
MSNIKNSDSPLRKDFYFEKFSPVAYCWNLVKNTWLEKQKQILPNFFIENFACLPFYLLLLLW